MLLLHGEIRRYMLLSLVHNTSADGASLSSTRERLVLAAAKLFQQRGYHSVSTAEILTLAKVPRGSLYHHFPKGKAQLATVTLDWLADEVIKAIQMMRLKGTKPGKVVNIIITNIGQWLKLVNYSESPLFTALTIGLSEDDDSALAESITAAYLRIQTEYEQMFLVEGLTKADARYLSISVVSIIEGSTILSRAMRNLKHLDKAKRNLTDLLQQYGVSQ